MSSFALTYWKSKRGDLERVYINGDFVNDLKIYFHKDTGPGEQPRVFGSETRLDYPAPYCGVDNPKEAVAYDALEGNGLNPDNFTWEELLEVAG